MAKKKEKIKHCAGFSTLNINKVLLNKFSSRKERQAVLRKCSLKKLLERNPVWRVENSPNLEVVNFDSSCVLVLPKYNSFHSISIKYQVGETTFTAHASKLLKAQQDF